MELDDRDRKATAAFEGYGVRKDLVRTFSRQFPMPTLGGSIEPVHNAVTLAELAIEKGAKSLLLPVACRKQLFDLSDDMATKLDIEFYQDARDALLKALVN